MARRVRGPDLSARPDPARSYDDAVARIDAVRAQEAGEPLAPEGPGIAMLTGEHSSRAVVIFHGYTVMPRQFQLIAEGYRAVGCNVWVPRMPFHGYADRMSRDMSRLTAELLREHADSAVDIAAGLGKEVTAVGLSGGGAIATWCAVERAEVTETVAISPVVQPLGVPAWATRAVVRVVRARAVLDVYRWWYPQLKERSPGYGYPRYTYKGIAAILGLVYWTEQVAEDRPFPVAGRYTLVRNNGDQHLDGEVAEALARRLVQPECLRVVTIPQHAGLLHDVVAWEESGENHARIGVAYAYLADAFGIELPDPLAARQAPAARTVRL